MLCTGGALTLVTFHRGSQKVVAIYHNFVPLLVTNTNPGNVLDATRSVPLHQSNFHQSNSTNTINRVPPLVS